MLEKVFLISFMVYGIWITFQPGMIFEKVGNFIVEKLGEFYSKPVTECPTCMSFWHGTYLYWFIWGSSVKEWGIVVIGAMGVSIVLSKLFHPEATVKEDESH